MTKAVQLSAIVWKEHGNYTALCPQLDIASQGKTRAEAEKMLKEAVELYLEEAHARKRLSPVTCKLFKTSIR